MVIFFIVLYLLCLECDAKFTVDVKNQSKVTKITSQYGTTTKRRLSYEWENIPSTKVIKLTSVDSEYSQPRDINDKIMFDHPTELTKYDFVVTPFHKKKVKKPKTLINEETKDEFAAKTTKSIAEYITNGKNNSTNMVKHNGINFMDIIEENKKYGKFEDICAKKSFKRVHGGIAVNTTVVPYMALLRRTVHQGLAFMAHCSASIITLRHVIVAAHCVYDYLNSKEVLVVVAGTERADALATIQEEKEHSRKISDLYIHEKFKRQILQHDISIAQLEYPFVMSSRIQPIHLHTRDVDWKLQPKMKCLLAGFGKLTNGPEPENEQNLHMVCLKLISLEACSWDYESKYLSESKMCAGSSGPGPCKGDSGSPLVCNGVLSGIVSAGHNCGKAPGIFSKILWYTTNAMLGEDVYFIRFRAETQTRISPSSSAADLSPVFILFILIYGCMFILLH